MAIKSEIFAQFKLVTPDGEELDWTGADKISFRWNLGAADEFQMDFPAKTQDNQWRPDMPVWKNGAQFSLWVGWDGSFDPLQKFEIVSTTNSYPESNGETAVVRAVSQLARAARNKTSRTFKTETDGQILDALCAEYGWTNGVDPRRLVYLFKNGRTKKAGTSDLELLRLIANQSRIGGPRVDFFGTLLMPEPDVGKLEFWRGTMEETADARRLHSFEPNRESGHNSTRVTVRSWDPVQSKFVETIFEANEFQGDPVIVYSGPAKTQPDGSESSTTGMVLSVIKETGTKKKERHDVLASSKYGDETDAKELASRWFELREKLSRWGTATVDGHKDLQPYSAIKLAGDMAEIDKGLWLPTYIDHTIDSNGWLASARCIRIVTDPVMQATTEDA